MPLSNQQLADLFNDIADRLEIQGEVVFKVRAYRTAAENIASHPRPLAELWAEGKLDEVSGVGKEIAKKIDELMRTGQLAFYERLRAEVPDGVAALLRVPGVGPKRAKEFWEKLGVDSIEALEAAARAGKLRALPRMGERAEQSILAGIDALKRRAVGRFRLGDVRPLAERLIAALRAVPSVYAVEAAGSLRRGKETIGDLDLLVATDDPAPVIRAFLEQPGVAQVLAAGETKASVRLENGLQVDIRALSPRVWGTALQYFTGSQQHNIRIREIAQRQGFSLNEYALTRLADGAEEQFADEASLYARLGMAWIPPELREDRGEIEAALAAGPGGQVVPDLVALADLRGDLQMHTAWSDGTGDVMGMARAAIALGYEYILITDHTAGLGIANGLTPSRLADQRREIDAVNAQLLREGVRFRVLQGAEVEVRSDGSLDLPDEALAQLDLVQIALHTGLNQPREKITARVLRALENPFVHILGHPSGRLLNERDGADCDWEAVFQAAKARGVALEINSDPARLDLSDVLARRAAELGCWLSISTDAHAPEGLSSITYGITVARRAWVPARQVINTWPLERLLAWARRTHT
ncbi:MAG: DNA polymerase/3'-5' exonuclease PolX [Anaerolineae bacterium]|nr:DNA polymerase/3'-5' exonuclease PolX [Thermoflexales bacterium]MDW8396760.1 DNA polymerase/3'-5' exonuclease PolX [Anaerolineae bacterium]